MKNFISNCSITNVDIDIESITTEDQGQGDLASLSSCCSIPVVHITQDILNAQPLNLVTEENYKTSLFTTLPVCYLSSDMRKEGFFCLVLFLMKRSNLGLSILS